MTNKPTSGMVSEAKKGLEWRSEYGRGGTEVGIARARDISNGKNLSDDTVKRMYSFFSRHEVDKKAEGFRPGEDGYPSNGRIAWALWGGDAGFSWSRKLADRMEKERSMENVGNSDIMPENIEGEVMTEVRDAETEIVADEVIDEVRQEETEGAAEEATDGAEETRLAPEKLISRAVSAEKKVIDVEARRVQIAVSSEEPVERGYGN